MAVAFAAGAQKTYDVTLLQPTAGQDIVKDQSYTASFKVKNTGSMAITMADTIMAMIMVGQDMCQMGGTMANINPGESATFQMPFHYSNFNSNMDNVSFCVYVGVTGVDTANSNYASCEMVNLRMSPAGITEQMNSQKISLFPNPANDHLVLSTPAGVKGTLQLYDVNGKKAVNNTIEGTDTKVSTSNLAEGLYFYQVNDADGKQIQNGKIVIQH